MIHIEPEMFDEAGVVLHRYQELPTPELLIFERTMNRGMARYGTYSEPTNYNAADNFYVLKEGLIKAEIFHKFTKIKEVRYIIFLPPKTKPKSVDVIYMLACAEDYRKKNGDCYPVNNDLWRYLKKKAEDQNFCAGVVGCVRVNETKKRQITFKIEGSKIHAGIDRVLFNKYYGRYFREDTK